MSKVKRFRADWRHVVETEFDDAQYVGVADFDRVTAERDALQQLLNASDQKVDDAATENNERELSRRDWFDEAQRLERENEELKADIKLLKSDLRIANDTAALGAKLLAERDALLRLARQFVVNGVDLGYITMPDAETPDPAHDLVPMIEAALSASAEPKRITGIDPGCEKGSWSAPSRVVDCQDCGDTGVEPCSKHWWKP